MYVTSGHPDDSFTPLPYLPSPTAQIAQLPSFFFVTPLTLPTTTTTTTTFTPFPPPYNILSHLIHSFIHSFLPPSPFSDDLI